MQFGFEHDRQTKVAEDLSRIVSVKPSHLTGTDWLVICRLCHLYAAIRRRHQYTDDFVIRYSGVNETDISFLAILADDINVFITVNCYFPAPAIRSKGGRADYQGYFGKIIVTAVTGKCHGFIFGHTHNFQRKGRTLLKGSNHYRICLNRLIQNVAC